MKNLKHKAIAVVGVGAVLPQAPDAATFWKNIKEGRYSITDVQNNRWDPELYYDADPKVPDKSYSKIGGWVREWEWDPLKWRMPIPPRVSDVMDLTQIWALVVARQILNDYGYPDRPLNNERTAVILGNAMGGDSHLYTASRILYPEYEKEIASASSFKDLSPELQKTFLKEIRARVDKRYPQITEDTMPGELSNIVSGRIAALYNFRGPNFVTDAACASAMAAISAAIEGLEEKHFDAVITGGIDANMSASTFVKFCKIGALSATGTRPYADGADGFVMGEGAALFLLKRLEDAESDQDKIYAVLRGMGGSSDGKGKGITAPNPIGQKLAVQRGWENAGLSPETATMIEGHGTSTKVGDVAEVESLHEVFNQFNLPPKSIPLGSVKSNIGHLKGAAGAAGILKTVLSLHEKVIPPSLNFDKPNPNIDFSKSPFYVNTELKPWEETRDGIRRAGVSAFGFGGTNFHAVIEEYIPGRNMQERKTLFAGEDISQPSPTKISAKSPLQGALVIGAQSESDLIQKLNAIKTKVDNNDLPKINPPLREDLRSPIRVAVDYSENQELADKIDKIISAVQSDKAAAWRALRAKGSFLGKGEPAKLAFLYTGQGSQYANMLKGLKEREQIVAETFAEADEVMKPLIGKPLTDLIFVDGNDKNAVAKAEENLKQTAITQPAVLTIDVALTRLFAAYGISPDMVMGHSLGEYGALVAAGSLTLPEALKAVSARGSEMTKVSVADNGLMAAAFGPIEEIEKIISKIDGYVVIANINSNKQVVIGGETKAVEKAVAKIRDAGYTAQQLTVSHAFHTKIVAPASGPMGEILSKMNLCSPQIPIISNVTGEFYPMGPEVKPGMVKMLSRQIAEPVQFVKGLDTLYDAGARVFVEVGPKRALHGFTEDVLGSREDVLALSTNHPRVGDIPSFNQALCGLYASGFGVGEITTEIEKPLEIKFEQPVPPNPQIHQMSQQTFQEDVSATSVRSREEIDKEGYLQLGQMFADFLEKGFEIYSGKKKSSAAEVVPERVCITGASIGLPGKDRVFSDSNIERILKGEQFIDQIPMHLRQAMINKNITRVVKDRDGGGRFETIDKVDDAVKLAARRMSFDLSEEFGYPKDRLPALDIVSQLAIAAGIDALRDAGIPLVLHYKTTTKGTLLPDKWGLPEDMRDDTGVIFGSAFPGQDSLAEIISGYYKYRIPYEQLEELKSLRSKLSQDMSDNKTAIGEIDRKIKSLEAELQKKNYTFDRRFLFRVLSMGHSQFAEYIGARGPNTQINGACASGTQGVAMAQDWIQAGRCRRVIVISADDITGDNSIEWFGAGFLASGAAATDEDVKEAAIPFDRRRHGLIIGMGSAAVVVESLKSARERGIQPICEVLSSMIANSAFHGSRLDVNHICGVMEKLISGAEKKWGIDRYQIAPQTVFVSHETYTPARGGSASAEVFALRSVFGKAADQVVIANTKGFTGHPMGVGVEDVVAIKILETGIVPPVANFKEIDPELGALNLSKGGEYPVRYALRLGAGFGSQISMTLVRWVPTADGKHHLPNSLGFDYRISDQDLWKAWLNKITAYQDPDLEVYKRTLRIKDKGPVKEAEKPIVAQPKIEPMVETRVAEKEIVKQEIAVESKQVVSDGVQEKVLQIIAEQTGYPTDMLDLELDLEADLGIDTVKQAEMFAAIRAAYNIPRNDNLKLRDFPTLRHAIQFVYDNRPDLKAGQPGVMVKTAEAAMAQEISPGSPKEKSVDESVKAKIMEIISEQTGYPTDMLDLELDLEADLGIDTVKQAEMFAAIRAEYDIPRDDNLKLRDFPTLAHAIQFVFDRRPDLKSAASSQPTPVARTPRQEPEAKTPADATADGEVKKKVLEIISEQTGYPEDMLDLELDLEADLGIDTVKQAEMFAAIRAAYDIPRDDNLKLRDFPTLAHAIQFVYDRRPDLKPTMPEPEAKEIAPSMTPEPAAVTAPISDEGPVKKKILEIISEQTGYPADMLDPELDLEADLGIDTVKQAEMFAAIRAAYDIPRDDNLKLRDYPTLHHAIQFVYDQRPDLAGGAAEVETEVRESEGKVERIAETKHKVKGDLDAANKIPRRIPVPHMRPALNWCKSTGVKLDSKSRVIVMPDTSGAGKALVIKLKKLGVETLELDSKAARENLAGQISEWKKNGPIQGIYWLPALDDEGSIFEMNDKSWKNAVQLRIKSLYEATRALYDQVNKKGTFIISSTRLGGQHGYDENGALAPMGGAVCGFTKAYKRERTDALVKVVDFERAKKAAEIADLLIEETLSDSGAVEVGYKNGQRWTIGFEENPIGEAKTGIKLNKNTVFLVTGAAGSIVSAIITDLAEASGGTFHLIDLVPKPDPNNSDLRRFINDKENLKKDIFQRLKEKEERATPAMVEKELAAIERAHAALSAIEAIEDSGGEAYYHCINLLDKKAVAKVIEEIRTKHGRIDVLVHAGGLEISHFLPDKKMGEFDLVFDVKSEGWFNILSSVGNMPLRNAVVFSSIAGRFGNGGQTDYSAANDFLCKSISAFRSIHPETRGIAIDWTAWGGIGMATRGSIPTIMKQAGIDMLPPEAGIPIVRRELMNIGEGNEVIVGQSLGLMLNEFDETGGLSVNQVNKSLKSAGVMVGKITGMGLYSGLTIETELDPRKQPFLYDHQIDNTPVLPGVMGIEAMAEAAKVFFPDLHIDAIEEVNFSSPFKFYRNEPRVVTTRVQFIPDGKNILAQCQLIGTRKLHGQDESQETIHFTAKIRLTSSKPKKMKGKAPGLTKGKKVDTGEIYKLYFHGPAYQVIDSSWRSGQTVIGLMTKNLLPNHYPDKFTTQVSPRLIELCFQTAGIWEMGLSEKMGLPYHINSVKIFKNGDLTEGGKLFAVVTPMKNGGFDAYVVDETGDLYSKLDGYSTMQVPESLDLEKLKPLKAALENRPQKKPKK
jgi:acyl transferase domain-containing protein/acyl carrier protein/NAD(P)-dependent dehydrogenase (short-subunit alcohol dehydrogenase family)